MSDREEAGDNVKNRMSERFGDSESDGRDEPTESDEQSEPAGSSERSEQSAPGESGENDENDSSELNVKEDWKGRYMYIPPAMHKRFDDEYERLRYECGRDLDWKPKKNQHYYPIVATEGIEDVSGMGPDAFLEAVTSLEYFDKESLLNE